MKFYLHKFQHIEIELESKNKSEMSQYYAVYSSIVRDSMNNVVISGVVDGQLDTGIILTRNKNLLILEIILSKWMVNGEILSVRF